MLMIVFPMPLYLLILIIPYSVHAKPGLWNPHPRDSRQEFVLPPIYLQPSLLIVGNGNPLVGPIARRHGIAMPTARGRRVQADLALNDAFVRQLEGGDVAGEVEAVGARRGEEILGRVRKSTHVGAVLGPAIGDARRDQGEMAVREDGQVSLGIDAIFADAVALFHEGVEMVSRGMDGDPSGVVTRIWTVDGAYELELRRLGLLLLLLMDPELVGREIGRVEVRLGRIKDHAVDARVGLVLEVLDVARQGAGRGVGGKDGAVAGVAVEGVAVDCVGGLLGGEEEDGAGVCFGGGGLSCEGLDFHQKT